MYDAIKSISEQIKYATIDEISDIIIAVVLRYCELFPEWEIIVTTVKRGDFDEQIRIMQYTIEMLTRLRDAQKDLP